MRLFIRLFVLIFGLTALARAEVAVREISYVGQLSENEARFGVEVAVEATGKEEGVVTLFDGEVAVLPGKLPANLRLVREGNQYRLVVAREGRYRFKVDLVAKIARAEPWNRVSFTGPAAAIASVAAQANGAGVEVQLLSGTLQESVTKDGVTRIRGFLGAERTVAVRWQSKAAEVARQALLTCETSATVQVTPTVVKYVTVLRYEIVQGSAARLVVTLPAAQALTKLQGEGVRDWQVKTEGGQQALTVEFIKPVEKVYTLTLFSEQPVEGGAPTVAIVPPQPQDVERETGALAVAAEDVVVETDATTGLRQVNAAAGAVAAYQFYARPFALTVRLRRIEPVINVADRVTVRLEEARLLVTHAMTLQVEQAGVYALELVPPAGLVVADVRGDGVEDWKRTGGKLLVNFSSRVLGVRKLVVQLEQAQQVGPEPIVIAPLRVTAAAKETAQVGAVAVAGIQLKTVTEGLAGLREVPISRLPARVDETLAYVAEQADWKLTLAAERMAARITADVFNLITIGDGLLGGSATIRLAIINQGVQEFRVQVPALWKNVEFTAPNIRRKELQGDTWVIGLQEKAWGGYTLVVTYDYQFDPHKATLPIGGIHPEGVERETGSVAITSAANLQLAAQPSGDNIRRIDEAELADNDRALITRPVLMAYKYQGGVYGLGVDVTRFEELPVLDAAADRTQLTTVLTEAGQMLTQASFMVKNNDRQFQTFTLPAGADFWACYVATEPVKPEKNGNKLLVPLPRRANRDESFAVDIVYAQKMDSLKTMTPRRIALAAPETDMQTTYAEWELYVPQTHRLASFGGNMIVARGTTYGLRDAWHKCREFYDALLSQPGLLMSTLVVVILFAFTIVAFIQRRLMLGTALLVVSVLLSIWIVSRELRPLRIVAAIGMSDPTKLPPMAKFLGEMMRERRASASSNIRQIDEGVKMDEALNGDESRAPLDGPAGDGTGPFAEGLSATITNNFATSAKAIGAIRSPDSTVPFHLSPTSLGALLQSEERPLPIVTAAGVLQPVTKAPMVAGIRPIRIDIPRTGTRFVFTKVLNVGKEPLAVRAVAMEQKVYNAIRGVAQAVAFGAGVVLVWWQWRRQPPHAVLLAVGLALALGAVVSLLVAWRLLGEALIVGAPVMGLALAIWLVQKVWKKKDENGGAGIPPPVVAAIAVLLLAMSAAEAGESNQVSILSANYVGVVRPVDGVAGGRVVEFEAAFELEAGEANQTVKLFGSDVAVQEFSGPKRGGWFGSSGATAAQLVREGANVSVWLPQKGKTAVRVKFLVKLGGDVAKRQIVFGIPPAVTSRVAVTIDEAEALVEVPQAVSFQSTPGGQQTVVAAVLAASDRVELNWTPRMKRAAETVATVFCQNTALVSFGRGVVNVRAQLDYQVTQGELRQLQVKLPAGQRLMRVEGEGIRTWKLDGATLQVELVKGVTPAYRLLVETEAVLDGQAEQPVAIEIPHAGGVKRETGLVALKAIDELSGFVEQQAELQKVDVEEFVRSMATTGVSSSYRFLRPEFALGVRVAPVQPQVEAVVRNFARVGTEQLTVQAVVEYAIKRAGVFTLRVQLPAGYRVEQVTGHNVAQWVEKPGAPRVLEVTLKERTLGAYQLTVNLAQAVRELPAAVAVVGVWPVGVEKVTGFVSVAAEEGVQIKSESFTGLTEVPAPGGSTLAFKLIPGEAGAVPDWQLRVTTERIESWVRAEVMNTVTLTETLVSGRSVVRYEIQNAPTKEFRLRLPAAFKNTEITGANIRRQDRDEVTGEWRVELQNKVRGVFALTVTWEQPWNVKDGRLELTGVEAAGVERETGALAVVAPSRLRLEPQTVAADLLKIDVRDLPEWVERTGAPPVLVYHYLRPGYKLTLATQRFEEAEVLQALIDSVRLTTVVAEDGQMMTEMTLAVRNNARQYLEVTLPAGAQVWSAFVAGQPVRPSRRDGKLLLPLERSVGDAPVAVELTYVGAGKFPARRGSVGLVSPALDVPLKNARWELYLPPDYSYSDFAGTMKREVTETVRTVPVAQTYSYGEYAQAETANKVARDSEVSSSLSNARSQLTGGKLGQALVLLNSAKEKVATDDQRGNDELKKLEKDLRREQGRGLYQAQQAFTANNGFVQQADKDQSYNAEAVEQQAAKVQQAQEVAVVKTLPLRINLPKRGARATFTQVLQTEVGLPMTVQFAAVNEGGGEWLRWMGFGTVGFVMLWVATVWGLARRKI